MENKIKAEIWQTNLHANTIPQDKQYQPKLFGRRGGTEGEFDSSGGGGSIVERGMRAMGHGGRLNRLSRLCAESKAVRPCVALN